MELTIDQALSRCPLSHRAVTQTGMTAMSHTYHLMRRNGVWSYRRRVPTHLVESFGKEIIQFSLATRNLKEALKRRAAEDLKWSTRFEAAEKDLGRGGSETNREPG